MPRQQAIVFSLVIVVSICFVTPSHGDDLSNLKTVLKSASPRQKIEEINQRSFEYLRKSASDDVLKVLYATGVNEDEDLGVRLAAIRTVFRFAGSVPGRSRLGVLKPEFEATYRASESDDVSRMIALSVFLRLNFEPDRKIESPPWLAENDPSQELVTGLQLLLKSQYQKAFPILVKRLDDDRIQSLFATIFLVSVASNVLQPTGGIELPPWFDLPTPVLIRQLRLWRKSEDHVRLAHAFKVASPELIDPVRAVVMLLGLAYVHNESRPQDDPALSTLVEVMNDDSVSESARRDAAYWLDRKTPVNRGPERLDSEADEQ